MICQKALDLIKTFEGLYLKRYICPAGVPTIGYGTTQWWDGGKIPEGAEVTKEQAEQLLMRDVVSFETRVRGRCGAFGENKIGALTSFAYNLGFAALSGSTLLRKSLAGDDDGAANEFGKWVNAGGRKLPGLVRRREAESLLYLTPDDEGEDASVETEG